MVTPALEMGLFTHPEDVQGAISVTGSPLGTGPQGLTPCRAVQPGLLEGAGEGCDPRINTSSLQRLWAYGGGLPPSSLFPSSSLQGRICATAGAVPGTGQHWSSSCFLQVELGTIPGTSDTMEGMLVLGSGQRKDNPPPFAEACRTGLHQAGFAP